MRTSADTLLGKAVSGYTLNQCIRKDSLAVVYRASARKNNSIDRLLVIMLSTSSTHAEQALFRERFFSIAQQTSRMLHPLLLPWSGYGEAHGHLYLLSPDTQAIDTLGTRLRMRDRWRPEEAITILFLLGAAFAYQRNQGLPYQFFDPDDILLLEDNSLQVNNLGLAHMLSAIGQEGEAAAPSTYAHLQNVAGGYLGVPRYLAPEVIRGSHPDNRSDVYIFGSLLFEMLSGHPRFVGKDYLAVALKHLHGPWPPLREFYPGVPQEIEQVILRALHLNPAHRYQSVSDLFTAYRAALILLSSPQLPSAAVAQLAAPKTSSTTTIEAEIMAKISGVPELEETAWQADNNPGATRPTPGSARSSTRPREQENRRRPAVKVTQIEETLLAPPPPPQSAPPVPMPTPPAEQRPLPVPVNRVPRNMSQQSERRTPLLLIILIFAAYLSSLPLTQQMLPASITGLGKPTVQPTTVQSASTGECTATPENTKYMSGSSEKTLPPTWSQAGRTIKDLTNAQACAVTFIVTYNTFNAVDPKSLNNPLAMLSTGGQQRFNSGLHMTPQWQAIAKRQHLQQQTQAAAPTPDKPLTVRDQLVVWMTVHSKIASTSIDHPQPITLERDFFVLLLWSHSTNQPQGTGWQVSDWRERGPNDRVENLPISQPL